MRVCICPITVLLIMIFCINTGLANMPNDNNQSTQNDSPIINPHPMIFSLKEHRWDDMSGTITSNASTFKDSLGRSHIFVIGADNGLWDNVDGVWQGLGGTITSVPCAVEDRQGVTHIFVIGTDGALFDRVLGTGWTNLGGYVTSNPSAALSPDGHIKIAVKGGDNSLWVKDLTTGEWSGLGGKITSNPQLIFDLHGKMHVLAQGGDGALWDNVDGNWQYRGGLMTSDARPIINPFNPRFIYTSVRGIDGALWCNALDTASGTSTWTGLGGLIAGTPSPSVDTDGMLHNFVRGGDGGLWDNVDGGWYGLGGLIVSDPCAFRDKDGKLRVAVVGGANGLWVNTIGIGMTPTTLVGSFACDYNKIQSAINAISSGGIIKVLSGSYPEDVNIDKELTLIGIGNPTASSFALNTILGTDSGGITAPLITVNTGFKIQQGIDLANTGASVNVNGAAGYTYRDDLTQSFYARGITLTGINNPVINSFTLNQDIAGRIRGITANTVNVNANAKIQQGIDLANTGASVNVNGAAGYTYSDDLTQSFYARGITLNGINNPVINSFTLNQDIAGRISGITANNVNVNANAKIQQGVDLANTGASVNVNGAAGYTYCDDLTQSFYAKGVTLTGINNAVTKSISLDQLLAGKISGITAKTVNVLNPNAKIQEGVTIVNSGGTINVGAGNYLEDVDINKDLVLIGTGNPIVASISLNAALGTCPYGIYASKVTVNPPSKILDSILISSKDVFVNGVAGYTYGDDLTQSFYARGITLTGINNPVINTFTLDQDVAGRINGITANNVNVNANAKIQQGIYLANTGASVNVNGAAGYTYSDDLTQSFYAKGVTLTGINNAVTKSISLDQLLAGKISGITAKTVNVLNPNAKIQEGVTIVNSGGTINVGAGNYLEDVDINKDLVLIGTGNPIVTSISLNAALGTCPYGIYASKVTVNPPSKILDSILISSKDVFVNGVAGYTYSDDLTQSFYARGITLTGINNPVINSFTLDQDIAGKISGIAANTVNLNANANAKIQQGIDLANTGASVNVNGATGYTYGDDLTQSFYARGITLTGINNPVIKSFTLNQDIAGRISGITANTVNVNANAKIQQGIDLANTGASVNLNGAAGYTYSDDLTQSFYARGITLTGINNPVIKSFTLNQDIAGRISRITANTVNVNANAKIQQGIDLANTGASVNVNGAAGYTYSDDLTQSFYARGITLTGINNPVINSFTLDQDIAGKISGITANHVNVNANAKIQQGIDLANTGASVNVNGAAGYTYSDDLTQSFYARGVTLTGINNAVTKSISLDQLLAGKISGITAKTVNVLNPNAKIQEGVTIVNSGGTINVGAGNYLEDVDINKDLVLIGTGNPIVTSISLNAALGTCPYGISASKVTVNPPSKILDSILISSKDVFVNGVAGYTYGDDLTQSFYARGITLTGINNPVINSFTLNQDIAGRIRGIRANTVNVNANAKIQQGIDLANTGASVNVNGAAGYTYRDDLTQSFYARGITLTGINNPVINSFTLDQDIAGRISGITANTVNVNANAKIQDGVILASSVGTVNVAAGNYRENVMVDKSLTVNGAGAGSSIVDGNKAGSVFILGKNDTNVDVSLSGMTLTGGTGSQDTGGTFGGGIINYGSLLVTDCAISGNTAGWGGGIQNSGIATISDTTISGNMANIEGGGISSSGTLTVNNDSISGNTANDGGGGIGNSGTLTMNSGSITENTATDGGGICSLGGTVNIDGGSINKNMAKVSGGGIYSQGTVHLHGGNITGNVASDGGGIYSSGTITMNKGSINRNTANNGTSGGIFNTGTLNLGGGNITENTATNEEGVYSPIYSHIAFYGEQVVIKSNKAHLPSPSELNWYQGWGVYLENGTPATTGNFNQATQVTGNIHI